jgi:NAD(P)-dependent dehydrogenase (short-subunit alcohol dehydrogenase family)
MSKVCLDRVVVVTGAGAGLGRSHARELGRAGGKVIVNDVSDAAAKAVVAEILAEGGTAEANNDDVSSWSGAKNLIDHAVDAYGALHGLVNNAGITRDRMLVNMTEEEWDAVIAVHLKGTFACSRHAAAYWRQRHKDGKQLEGAIVNTSSPTGLFGNAGQVNYGAAKAGIANMTIIMSLELASYGVTANCIAPIARTAMTANSKTISKAPEDPSEFDPWTPDNVAPLVAWLVGEQARHVTGRVFAINGGRLGVDEGWVLGPQITRDRRWSVDELLPAVNELLAKAAPNANTRGERE